MSLSAGQNKNRLRHGVKMAVRALPFGECPKERFNGIIKDMRKRTEETWKKCPKCGKIENQIKAGYNGSGSQRCKCKECGIYYTINPKQHEYPEETRELAIKMYYAGVSGRSVGKILHMNKSNVMNWIKKERQKGS